MDVPLRTSEAPVHDMCCRSAVLRTILNFRLASANAKEDSTLFGSIDSLSSSASLVRDWLLSTEAVSLVTLGFLLYFARISSVMSTERKIDVR